jgi:hypothetical protein
MGDPPTREFLRWNGEKFHEQQSPAYYKRQERRLTKLRGSQKQNPVPAHGTPCTSPRDITVYQPTVHSPAELSLPTVHTADPACTDQRDISRLTTRRLKKRSGEQDCKGQADAAVRLPSPDSESGAKDDGRESLRRYLDELVLRKRSEGR